MSTLTKDAAKYGISERNLRRIKSKIKKGYELKLRAETVMKLLLSKDDS